jgi:hypothetical protein
MSRLQRLHPSPGTALGLLALIVALAGTANAGPTRVVVHRGDIAPGAVTAKAIAKGAVTTKKLRKGAITAAKLAPGAVGSGALAKDSVTAAALRAGAVGPAALAANAVTASAIAPGSVYGAALGPVSVYSKPIADLDEVEENGKWTASNTETVECALGERLLTGGIFITNPGNREVGIIEALPVSINDAFQGYSARLTSNSGGTSTAEVRAICLR